MVFTILSHSHGILKAYFRKNWLQWRIVQESLCVFALEIDSVGHMEEALDKVFTFSKSPIWLEKLDFSFRKQMKTQIRML